MKPTPEQIARLREGAKFFRDSGAVDPASEFFGDYLADTFEFVADMVLEEAIRRMDELESWDETALIGQAVIRVVDLGIVMKKLQDMKGTR